MWRCNLRDINYSPELDMLLWRFWVFGRQGDVVVAADVFEGFATEGFSLGWAAKLGEFFTTGTKITVEGGIRYIGQNGQF